MDKINEPWVVRDSNGRPTGVINGDGGTGQIRNAAGFLKELPKDIFESSSMADAQGSQQRRPDIVRRWSTVQEDIYRQWQREKFA